MSAPRRGRRALFFDRDGTLNREVEEVLARPEDLELLPGAARAVARVNAAGILAVVVTNQSAIARGTLSPWELERVHAELARRLSAEGARLDGIYHCPHLAEEGFPPYRRACACRKPGAGLLLRAAEELDLDLAGSWVVGDAARDLAAAAGAGARSVLVRTGKGVRESAEVAGLPPELRPAHVADGVLAAVEWIESAGGLQAR